MLDKLSIKELRPRLNIHLGRFWANIGWYGGDPFKLLDITIFEYDRNWKSKQIDWITIFGLQLAGHLHFGFGWNKE